MINCVFMGQGESVHFVREFSLEQFGKLTQVCSNECIKDFVGKRYQTFNDYLITRILMFITEYLAIL